MELITFESEAYNKLRENLISEVRSSVKTTVLDFLHQKENLQQWISSDEAMKLLNIKSKTTLANLRKDDSITYSQYGGTIAYWKESIMNYIKAHSNACE